MFLDREDKPTQKAGGRFTSIFTGRTSLHIPFQYGLSARLLGHKICKFNKLLIVDTFHSYQARQNPFVISLSRHCLRSSDNLITKAVAYLVLHPVCELVFDRRKLFVVEFPISMCRLLSPGNL